MNRVELRGGLVKDPETRFAGQALVTEFLLAVNGTRYDREAGQQVVKSIFVNCQAWVSLGEELAEERLAKGDEIYVLGELDQVKREGRDVPSTRVVVMSYSVIRRRHPKTSGSPWTD